MAGVIITLNVMLALWSRNIMRIGYESALPTILGVSIGVALFTALIRPLAGGWAKAGIVSALVAVYLLYVPAIIAFTGAPPLNMALMNVAAALILFLVWRVMPKEESRFAVIAQRINLICLVLFAFAVVPVVSQTVGLERQRSKADSSFAPMDGNAGSNAPDVWHLLFDRYAAKSALQAGYEFDNSTFYEALRKRGFTVKEDAFSNYQRTGHSVAATMNGSMLDPLAKEMKTNGRDWVPIYRSIRNGEAFRQFNRMGYRTVWAGSWWEPTRFSEAAADTIQVKAQPQLLRLLIRDSSLGFWQRLLSLPILDDRGDQCFRANEKFRLLKELAATGEQKLVLGHFLIPHPPFVLKADGSCKTAVEAKKTSRRDNYVDQVRFVNEQVLELVDSILAGPRPAVIVVHSDEGPWPEPYVGDEHGLGTDTVTVPWADLTQEQMHEKFAILMAFRAPDGQPPELMPESPVQIYPSILREHFGSSQRIPESRHEVFLGKRQLYTFKDVSELLNADGAVSNQTQQPQAEPSD